MRCEEIQERFVDLLYNERGTPPASHELRAHIDSCPSCRRELEGLQRIRGTLKLWKDEAPLRPILVPAAERPNYRQLVTPWSVMRYVAVAALAALAFLALANADISWDKQGFAFRARLFSQKPSGSDYYTKAEVLNVLRQSLHESERNVNETNYLMIQRMMDAMEQENLQELRYVRKGLVQNQGKN